MTVGVLKAAVATAQSGRTEAQARLASFRADLARWYGARHASGSWGIIGPDGREVARLGKREDRDVIIAAIRFLPAVGPAITALAFAEETYANDPVALAQTTAAKEALIAALAEVEGAGLPATIEGKAS